MAAIQPPLSHWSEEERTRDRQTTRSAWVYAVPAQAPFDEWHDLASIIRVERSGTRGGKSFREQHFYISSCRTTAEVFGQRVRDHWAIENGLHWVKDVVLKEDACTSRAGQAPQNAALLRSIAVTLFRRAGHQSLTRARRFLAHDIHALLGLLE